MKSTKKVKMTSDHDHPKVEQASAPRELQLQETMDKVFGNHLLREMILERVIYPSNNTVSYADVPNIRLVEKSWLISTSKILRRNRDPLYNLNTSTINSRGEFLDIEEREILDNFVNTVAQPERIEGFIPPIGIEFVCSFFVPENRVVLSKFLVSCGPGLTSMDMMIPKRCTLPFVLPRFSLPNLQQFSIRFVTHSHSDGDDDDDDFHPTQDNFLRENTAVTYFIQQILNSSRELKKLEFTCSLWGGSDLIPSQMDFLCLPKSVTTLLIKCPFLAKHLEMMVPSDGKAISHLIKLEIMASEIPFPENTIHRILARHAGTLKEIKLSGKEFQAVDVNRPSLFKMPPSMKNLEEITLTSSSWLCGNFFHMNSTTNYPNLATFNMERVSVALFRQITDRYRVNLKTVKKLKVWLVGDQDARNRFKTTITLNLEHMQRAHLAFSSVSSLDITICGKAICGLKYVFKEMGQLTSLAINVKNVRGNNMTCEAWDGLLIGAPAGIAKGLRSDTDFLEYFTLVANENYPSIKRLTELTKLTLASSNMPIKYGSLSGMKGRMVSEVSFHYAFLEMTGLNDLHLFGRFQPNEAMMNLWKNGKEGTLVYGEERV